MSSHAGFQPKSCFVFFPTACEKRLRDVFSSCCFCISALTYLKFVAEPHKFDLEQKCLWGSLQSLLHLAPFSKVKHKFIANSICKSPVYISSCFDLFRRQGIVWLNPLEEEDQPMGCGLPDRSLATYLEIVCLKKFDTRKDIDCHLVDSCLLRNINPISNPQGSCKKALKFYY